jgi:hypothetical protein
VYTLVNSLGLTLLPKGVSPNGRIQVIAIGLLSVPALVLVFTAYDVKLNEFDSAQLYDLRVSMREENQSVLAGYAYGVSSKLLVAAIAAIAGIRRSLFLLAVAAGFAVSIFLIGGHKSVIGFFVAASLVGWFNRRIFDLSGAAIFLLCVLASGLIYVTSALFDHYLVHDMVLRRVLHLPGVLVYHYFEHFSGGANLLTSASIDSAKLPFVIGFESFGRAEMRANASGFASSYAQLGMTGLALFSVLYSLTIKFANDAIEVAHGFSKALMLAISSCYLWVLSESAITTVYVTHGLGVFFLIVYISGVRVTNLRRT